jgi:hypothetical protein
MGVFDCLKLNFLLKYFNILYFKGGQAQIQSFLLTQATSKSFQIKR